MSDYPTADAYEAACQALERHRARAETAEAEVARLREALEKVADPLTVADTYPQDRCNHLRAIARAALAKANKEEGE